MSMVISGGAVGLFSERSASIGTIVGQGPGQPQDALVAMSGAERLTELFDRCAGCVGEESAQEVWPI